MVNFIRLTAVLALVVAAGCMQKETNDLVWAATTGNLQRVNDLVAQGVSVDARAFDDGQTALIAAAMHGQMEVVKFLIAKGADVNLKDAGGTPLFWAAFRGQSATYQFLLSRGARLNADDASLARLLKIMDEKGFTSLAATVRVKAAQERG